tara:strand:- start:1200 stop:1916 length:717 start_codon:yes stop_codon:yes gene_type:complete
MIPDISIYGHMTIDTIFDDEKIYEFGGISNVWRALKKTNPNLIINLEPIHYGEAIIYIDKANSKRYSDAVLNMKTFEPRIFKSSINHILYLNEFDDTSFIQSIEGLNIADTCKGRELSDLQLENIDILLSADEDLVTVSKAVENFDGIFILHSPHGCEIEYKDYNFSYRLEKEYFLSDINVLGAGDIYAAFLINKIYKDQIHKLNNKDEIYENIIRMIGEVHIETSQYLNLVEIVHEL